MTESEAKTVLKIMMGADNFCPVCAGRMINAFITAFPEFFFFNEKNWAMKSIELLDQAWREKGWEGNYWEIDI